MKNEQKIYQEQIAKTVAMLLGEDFTPNHPVGKALNIAMEKPTEMLAVSNVVK
jgi:hypothetical protein